jgi:hypothetical protein
VVPQRARRRQQPLVLARDHVPAPHHRHALHVQHGDAPGLHLGGDGVGGQQRYAHLRHHRLLDGFVGAHLDAPGRHAVGAEQALHQHPRAGARFAQQEGVAGEFRQRDGTARGKPVGGAGDDDMRMIADHRHLHRRLVRRTAHHHEIEVEPRQPRQHFLAIADDDAQFDVRMPSAEGGQRARGEILGGADHAHRDAAGLHPLQRLHRLDAAGQLRFDPRGRLQRLAAGRGGARAGAAAFQQRQAERVFQQPQLQRHRLRRDARLLRRRGQRAGARHGGQRAQLLQRYAAERCLKFFFHPCEVN